MTRTAKVPCPGKNCKKRCEARCEICGVPLGWTELIDFRKELGRNSEGTRMTRKICWFFGCSGVPATCVQEESARSSRWEKLRGSDLKSSNFPSQQTEKQRVSLVILFMFLPLPKFKLLNLLRFHLYTWKTTLFLVLPVVQWVVFTSLRDLGFTTDGFSHASNVQLAESHRQLGMRREASVAKVPSNSNLDANCNLIVCQLASWMEPHISTGCDILCSKYGQFPSHFRQEVAKKGLNCAFSGPCFLLNLLFFQRTRAQIPVYFGAWGQGHLDIVELAKCFLELSDFQAGCRRTVTFFVARLNPTIQDMKTHENNSLYFFFPLGPIICIELRISALRHKSRYTVACWFFSSSEDLARIADILIGL